MNIFGQELNVIHFDKENGLASNKIYDVCIGPLGKLWLATEAGVSVYDGYSFKNYDIGDGLADEDVLDIYQDDSNKLWFISFSGKLSMYENGIFSAYKHNETILNHKGAFLSAHVDFYIDSINSIHISFPKSGTIIVDSTGNASYPDEWKSDDDAVYLKLVQYNSDRFFYQTPKYKPALVPSSIVKTKLDFLNEKSIDLHTNRDYLKYDYVKGIKSGDSLIISVSRDLFIVSNETIVFHQKLERPIVDMKIKKGILYLGLHLGGFKMMDLQTMKAFRHLLKNKTISGFEFDNEGGLWMTSTLNGVYYLTNQNITSINKDMGLEDDNITSVYVNGQNIYTGNSNATANYLSNKKVVSSYTAGAKPFEVNNVLKYHDELFIHSKNYITIYKGKKWRLAQCPIENVYRPKCLIKSLYKDINGNLIFGGIGYVWQYNKKGQHRELFLDINRPIPFESIANRTKNSYWVGTPIGLFLLENKKLVGHNETHEILNQYINGVLKLDESRVLVATKSYGLTMYNYKDDKVTMIHDDLKVNRMLLDSEKNIWLASIDGLYKIESTWQELKEIKLRKFNEFSGLSSSHINDFFIQEDTLFLATDKGLNIVATIDLENDFHPPQLFIENVSINQHDTSLMGVYDLSYDMNRINIAYNAIDFKSAGQIRYSYRLKGIENAWNETYERKLSYVQLAPGTYELEIVAFDANGLKSEQDIRVKFIINPPVWKESWFVILILILFIASLVGFVLVYKRQLKERSERKIVDAREKAELEIGALRAQMNPHFIFNTLNSILYLIEKDDAKNSRKYVIEFSKLLRKIIENSPLEKISLETELNILESYIMLENLRFEKNIQFKVTVGQHLIKSQIMIPSLLLQPYVENAVVHGLLPSSKAGIIDLTITAENSSLKCIIRDNGIGRRKAKEIGNQNGKPHQSIGLSNTEKRIALVNGEQNDFVSVEINDLFEPNGIAAGTEVKLTIKI